jgi:hypothetical protein
MEEKNFERTVINRTVCREPHAVGHAEPLGSDDFIEALTNNCKEAEASEVLSSKFHFGLLRLFFRLVQN